MDWLFDIGYLVRPVGLSICYNQRFESWLSLLDFFIWSFEGAKVPKSCNFDALGGYWGVKEP
jgi:hypothetical protein